MLKKAIMCLTFIGVLLCGGVLVYQHYDKDAGYRVNIVQTNSSDDYEFNLAFLQNLEINGKRVVHSYTHTQAEEKDAVLALIKNALSDKPHVVVAIGRSAAEVIANTESHFDVFVIYVSDQETLVSLPDTDHTLKITSQTNGDITEQVKEALIKVLGGK